jgi:hypothetical protein
VAATRYAGWVRSTSAPVLPPAAVARPQQHGRRLAGQATGAIRAAGPRQAPARPPGGLVTQNAPLIMFSVAPGATERIPLLIGPPIPEGELAVVMDIGSLPRKMQAAGDCRIYRRALPLPCQQPLVRRLAPFRAWPGPCTGMADMGAARDACTRRFSNADSAGAVNESVLTWRAAIPSYSQ